MYCLLTYFSLFIHFQVRDLRIIESLFYFPTFKYVRKNIGEARIWFSEKTEYLEPFSDECYNREITQGGTGRGDKFNVGGTVRRSTQ
jgi:hypothetical protein